MCVCACDFSVKEGLSCVQSVGVFVNVCGSICERVWTQYRAEAFDCLNTLSSPPYHPSLHSTLNTHTGSRAGGKWMGTLPLGIHGFTHTHTHTSRHYPQVAMAFHPSLHIHPSSTKRLDVSRNATLKHAKSVGSSLALVQNNRM